MGATRRDFLKNSGLMVMAGAGFLTAEQWLRGADMDSDFRKRFQGREGDVGAPAGVSPRSVKDAGGPKDARLESPTIVTIFLRGGADALNAIVPYGDDGYYQARPRIAIPLQPKNG